LLSEVAIASPLRTYREAIFAERTHHIASCPSIETVKLRRRFFCRPDAALLIFSFSCELLRTVQKTMTQRDRTARFAHALLHYCNTSPVMKTKSGIIRCSSLVIRITGAQDQFPSKVRRQAG
jgi:hypothetical protein